MSRLIALILIVSLSAVTACGKSTPPPQLSASDEPLVRRCLELRHKQENSAECAHGVTAAMEKAFLDKHPDFHQRLIADRKAFVEERIAEDQRRRDDLNRCLDDGDAGNAQSSACEKFRPHEITRAMQDRRLRRCASARLDGQTDLQHHCEGLAVLDVEDEVKAERVRRAGRL